MGKSQRDKGKRNEYLLRDELRKYGYVADRVPTSGAAQGFKGDIKFSKEGTTRLAELKSRKDEFKKIYQLFDAYKKHAQDDRMAVVQCGVFMDVSSSPFAVLEEGGVYTFPDRFPFFEEFKRTFTKMFNMKRLVKECDMLVIKDDRKPFIYIRYR